MRRGHDEFPSDEVQMDAKSSFGEEKSGINYAKEHQLQLQQVQGRQSSSKFKRVQISSSKLSTCDSKSISSSNSSKRLSAGTMKAVAWRTSNWQTSSNSRWWEDFPGARMSVSLKAFLLLMVAVTFVCSVYIHQEGLKTCLFVAVDGISRCSSRSMLVNFAYDSSFLFQEQQERSVGKEILYIPSEPLG